MVGQVHALVELYREDLVREQVEEQGRLERHPEPQGVLIPHPNQ